MQPTVTIEPKECLADEAVKIRVHGLRSHQNVTIYAWLQRNDVDIFDSYAHYTATREGVVDISTQASAGGSYSGIEPMGLFWSMKSSPRNKRKRHRFMVKDVENPIDVSIQIFDSHLTYHDLCNSDYESLAKAFGRRWYKSPNVKRIPVRWKRVRGILFVPPGDGPFPTLIDLFGIAGGVIEYRASLLASRGFMSLALAYFDYDDLPSSLLDGIDLEYFEEATEFLNSLPQSNQNGVGIVGNSLGGMLALACCSYIPAFKCAVSINGPVFTYRVQLYYKNRTWNPRFGTDDFAYEEDGATVEKYCFDNEYDTNTLGSALIEFADCKKPFFFVFSNDDTALNIPKAAAFTRKLTENRKGDYKMAIYSGAGHLLEPPYFPHTSCTYVKATSKFHYWGGDPTKHAAAQERAWAEIGTFLKTHLTEGRSKL